MDFEPMVDAAVAAGKLTPAAAKNLKPWLTEKFYRPYRASLEKLIRDQQFAELDRLFWERIPFGTGGRRGPMGELGSATINRRTIAESAYGLGVYVKKSVGTKAWKAVVACDTRNRSQEFARVTASVLAALGYHVYCFEHPRSTPELSFAVRHLGCDTGAMISASHNPPSDNGFKAYWSTGGQVLAPHDARIIACVDSAGEIPELDFDQAVRDGQIELFGESLDKAYIAAVSSLSLSAARDIPALFTPLHGVGETSVFQVIRQAGFAQVHKFEPQCTQDGNFPNVPDHLPNPERPEVFQPAIEAAKGTDVALILASDPDADRLAVAVKDAAGAFHVLTGNQMGALLVDYILRKRQAAKTLSPKHFVVQTLVTTPMIATIAKSYGVRAIDNLLVGFKYIGETIDREGPEKFVFGAEESLGYLAGTYARDKDAAVAALYGLELAAELRREGKTLLDRLDELYAEHGVYLEGQVSLTSAGPQGIQEIGRILSTFRREPPSEVGDLKLKRVRDYLTQEVRQLPDNTRVEGITYPKGDLLIAEGESPDCEVTIALRPSGTEPKIKFYLFVRCTASGTVARRREIAERTLGNASRAWRGWADVVRRG